METLTYPEHPGFKAQGTSAEAAIGAAHCAPRIREAILVLLQQTPGGLTPDEAAARLQLHPLAVRPRFSELATTTASQPVSLIEPTGEKRLNRGFGGKPGKRAMVWRLAPWSDRNKIRWDQVVKQVSFAFEPGGNP